MMKHLRFVYFLLVLSAILGCKQEPVALNDDFDVVVRINRDIGRINPILSSSSRAREVYQYVFLNLADYDLKTLKLSPVLAEALPQKTSLDEGGVKYKFKILEDAVWDNGNPMTANDFLFTIKLVTHPGIATPGWKSVVSIIDDVILDPDDPKVIEFVVPKETLNSLESICLLEVYPEHIYDPEGVLSKIALADIRNETLANDLLKQDSSFAALATSFNSSKFGMDIVEGAGPYIIADWETDQYIRLKRKDDWWGFKYPDRTQLIANPSEIIFQIIADETTALTQLKGGGIDVMKVTNGSTFKGLSSESSDDLSFHKPKIRQFFFIAINNEDDIMKHKEVRQALALSIDVKKMVEVLEAGDAVPISGTIAPFVEGFESQHLAIEQNVEKAIKLLEDNGWEDANKNGIYDKLINGELTDISVNILASSNKGEDFGLLVKEFAKTVGMEVNITRKKRSLIFDDHIYTGDYQLYPSATSWDLSPYDPKGRWHSDNIKLRGQNICRYRSDAADDLINKISKETNADELMRMYHDFDELLYNDQPVIFLYAPLDRIVTSNKVSPLITNKRPSYFVNAFESKGVAAISDN